ncbi:hypothetical protein E2562_012876 [Oryza meyeriana var. granulata]|uniref:Uncharacterized protein n=1 Tax=Oryza meyeriana var. granulata TaxID=110450 RepID=A0A6G1CNR2_9ORYZ|nr:hypothetical protein E2562_012876 [Oryza meyeriana var. granulata]
MAMNGGSDNREAHATIQRWNVESAGLGQDDGLWSRLGWADSITGLGSRCVLKSGSGEGHCRVLRCTYIAEKSERVKFLIPSH